MSYSFDEKRKSNKNKIFNKEAFDILTEEQRQFAQTSYKKIYAEQMSKLVAEISHKRKIKQNLQKLDEVGQNSIKQTQDKLNKKIADSDRKRHENLEQKIKNYKMNDQRWHRKMQQIERKFKDKNREAIQKANLYRRQAQQYWENKKRKVESSRSRVSLNNSQSRSKEIHQKILNPILISLPKVKNKTVKKDTSKTLYTSSISHKDLDSQIRLHREKMLQLKSKQQSETFQKALQKLAKIQKSRINKKTQKKILQPTVVKKAAERSFQAKKRDHSYENLDHSQSYNMKNKQSVLDNLLKSHQQAKQQKQKQQFMHRGDVMERALLKNKKNKIIKLIKQKVHDMKLETLKGQF